MLFDARLFALINNLFNAGSLYACPLRWKWTPMEIRLNWHLISTRKRGKIWRCSSRACGRLKQNWDEVVNRVWSKLSNQDKEEKGSAVLHCTPWRCKLPTHHISTSGTTEDEWRNCDYRRADFFLKMICTRQPKFRDRFGWILWGMRHLSTLTFT